MLSNRHASSFALSTTNIPAVMDITLSSKLPASAVIIPIFSFIAILLEVPPFLWHVKNRNFAASCMIVYLFILQFMSLLNAIIWPRDSSLMRYDGRGLCDLEIRLQLMIVIGLPGCITCIIRRLAAILDTNKSVLSEASKARRRFAEDLFLCVGFPLLINALYYIVQPHRFWLFTVSGCKWPISYSWPSILIIQMWPIVLSVLNAYLASVVLYRLYRYRAGFSVLLSNSSTTKSRFLRLFMISIVLIFLVLPVSIQALIVPLREGYHSYDWNYTHYVDWGIQRVPTGGRIYAHEVDNIIGIVSGFLIFFCFGLGKDAVAMYRQWAKKLGLISVLPFLKERTPTTSMGSSMGSRRQITVTTIRESKSEPNSPNSTERRPSFLSFKFGKEKVSLEEQV